MSTTTTYNKRSILMEAAKQVERSGAYIRKAADHEEVTENIAALEKVIATLQEHIEHLRGLSRP